MIPVVISWLSLSCGALMLLRPSAITDARNQARGAVKQIRIRVGSQVSRRHESDLAICGRSSDSLAVEKTTTALVGGVAGLALMLICDQLSLGLGSTGGVILPAAGGGLGFFVPDARLIRAAGRRRKSFKFAFSSFLDLVTVLLAGGSGIESAMLIASESGDGHAFEQIRESLTRSQVARTSAWEELARLGRRFQIDEVVEVAGSIELAGRHGARIRETLGARATTLRHRQLSEIEADAAAATERMGMPMVLLFVGFITLVGYPAVAEMLRAW